jgi:hypothetical protein
MKPPKANPTRMTSVVLTTLIAFFTIDATARQGETSVAKEVREMVHRIIARQKAINVLRSRLDRHYNIQVMSLLFRLDPLFAEVFAQQHLHRPLVVQGELF